MQSLLGKPVVDALTAELEVLLADFVRASGRRPRLAVILVGDDPASHLYVTNKRKSADRLGIDHELHLFAAKATPVEVRTKVDELNQRLDVDGILIQRPLPAGFNLQEVSCWIEPSKDVDGFHPELVGKLALGIPALTPCTPTGIMALLEHYKIPVAGKLCCVVGRSPIVGKPLAAMLLNANATVVQCHRGTAQLAEITSRADVLFVAAGVARLVGREHVRPGAVVIDVGIHKLVDGSLTGDVRADELRDHAAALTPVPGGVGPLTIFMLMSNVVQAAHARLDTTRRSSVRKA